MKHNRIVRLVFMTAGVLLIPLAGNLLVEGWNWNLFDFVVAGGLIFGTSLAYTLLAERGGTAVYRAAVGLTLGAAFLLVWVNGAVGIIGDGPVNLLYGAVLFALLVGSAAVRFRSRGMAYVLGVTGVVQLLVPVFALLIWDVAALSWSPGILPVFVLNSGFALLFLGAAALFYTGARTHPLSTT